MSAFLTVVIIHLLAVASPGPDFVMVTRNALTFSRRTGVITAAGIALGLLMHSGYSLVGIGFLISRSILLFNIIKYLGAAYLIYIGWKALTARSDNQDFITNRKQECDIPARQAFSQGFLCNVLNPKATLFIFALFTQVIDPATPTVIQMWYGIYMSMATFIWFALLASVFSLDSIKRIFRHIHLAVERTMGAILIALGVKVALSTRY